MYAPPIHVLSDSQFNDSMHVCGTDEFLHLHADVLVIAPLGGTFVCCDLRPKGANIPARVAIIDL